MIIRSTKFMLRRGSQAAVPLMYLAASGIACAADFCVTVGFSRVGAPAALAATVGYLVGIVLHWVLSTRFVFSAALSLSARRKQKALFLLTGLLGLSVTVAIYTYACAIGIGPIEAKLLAVLGSFSITYLSRRYLVFRSEHVA